MVLRHVASLSLLVSACLGFSQTDYKPTPSELQDAYKRANEFQRKVDNTTFNLTLTSGWFEAGKRLWYRKDSPGSVKEFIEVDPKSGKKQPAFDHKRLAEALAKVLEKPVDPTQLPFSSLTYSVDAKSIEFKVGTTTYKATLDNYAVEKSSTSNGEILDSEEFDVEEPWRPAPSVDAFGFTKPPVQRQNPNLPYEARIKEGQIEIRKRGTEDWQVATKSGSFSNFEWAPDGKAMVAFRIIPGDRKPVYLLKSSVPGTTRAVLETRLYDQPGDQLDQYEAYTVNPETKAETKLAMDLITGGAYPWPGAPDVQWWGGKGILNITIRGYQEIKVLAIDMGASKVSTLVDEKSPTFLDTTKTMLRLQANRRDLIWRSERDGWSHLYKVNTETGEFKQLTKGQWVVRGIEYLDEAKGQIWFTANGVDAKQDPYHMQYCRVNLDGTGFVNLTPGDGTHTAVFSPTREFYVDTYSRVDSAPVHELRRSSDGSLVTVLEKADISALAKNGVQPTERFVAKARDGKTDIWGVVIRPSNFDPNKRYPIIENIYAGPHDSFVPKSYRPFYNMHRLAELGFIVVQIDGMGTSNRGKAFHDVCWHNVADAGFPDRILWVQALAKKYPQFDTNRVGLYGTSAGGQNSTGGVLFHPEFYKVAVSACGCHDNRIDKQWWNEQWMGYPVGPHYATNSNIDNAAKLKGRLLLIVGENDRNVPPETTIRLADALMRAQKEFDFVIIPGADHTDGGPYGERKRRDFFVKWLLGVDPPSWNN